MSHESLSVEIIDAGAGFDPEALRPGQGSGLIGMEERARSTGGTFEVVSAPRHGTRVMAELRLTAIRKRET
jgi:signal transduction histidine kinase